MFFNYPSYDILPSWLDASIEETRNLLDKAEKELKYGLTSAFNVIPFNVVLHNVIDEYHDNLREQFIKVSQKSYDIRVQDALLRETFAFRSSSLLVKKGVATGAKEALIISEKDDLPIFFFRTVYLLCCDIITGKTRFPISTHPLYPLFYRYMQEPLAVAMAISAVNIAFERRSNGSEIVIKYISKLPLNYYAGLALYESGIHHLWKNWRDDKKRCLGKIVTMDEWIQLFSSERNRPERDRILELWAKLFDVSIEDMQGFMAAAKYAPIIAEDEILSRLLKKLIVYIDDHSSGFSIQDFHRSSNPIARIIAQLIGKQISISDIEREVILYSDESTILNFIRVDLPGWTFSRDLQTGRFQIFGPSFFAITK